MRSAQRPPTLRPPASSSACHRPLAPPWSREVSLGGAAETILQPFATALGFLPLLVSVSPFIRKDHLANLLVKQKAVSLGPW